MPPGKPSSLRRFRALLLCAGLALLPSFAAAEGRVVQRFSSARPDEELEALLYLSMGVALGDRGYSSSKSPDKADYVLSTEYSESGSEVELRLSLAAAKGGQAAPASVDASVRLDLTLDEALASALLRLFELAELGRPSEAGGGAEIDGLFSLGLVNVADTLRTDKTKRLETMAYGGGLSFIGDFASYARFGATASLDAGLLRIARTWSLSAGTRLAVTRAFLNDGVQGGDFYMTTAGLNLQLGAGAGQAQRLSACVSGGAAFLTVAGPEGTLTKAVPYADAGLQAGMPLGRDFFLGADVRFLVAFDPEILIMGAAPTISLCKEF